MQLVKLHLMHHMEKQVALEGQFTEQLMGIGKPENVVNIIAYLLSDAAKYITGANYLLDGGGF